MLFFHNPQFQSFKHTGGHLRTTFIAVILMALMVSIAIASPPQKSSRDNNLKARIDQTCCTTGYCTCEECPAYDVGPEVNFVMRSSTTVSPPQTIIVRQNNSQFDVARNSRNTIPYTITDSFGSRYRARPGSNAEGEVARYAPKLVARVATHNYFS